MRCLAPGRKPQAEPAAAVSGWAGRDRAARPARPTALSRATAGACLPLSVGDALFECFPSQRSASGATVPVRLDRPC